MQGLSTVAQKGHRYFSTIVCIFPAYYNFLKNHFDFFFYFHPGGKYVKRHYEISRVWDKEKIASQFSIGIPIGSSDSQL